MVETPFVLKSHLIWMKSEQHCTPRVILLQTSTLAKDVALLHIQDLPVPRIFNPSTEICEVLRVNLSFRDTSADK